MDESSTAVLIGGAAGRHIVQPGATGNRHGLVAGATGTGKTVTLQVLAEGWSRLGVPVFAADIKGDLSGLAAPGRAHPKIDERVAAIGIDDYAARDTPVRFWDLFGAAGLPMRVTVSEMGPLLLARLLDLNETQTGVLYCAFAVADDHGLLLLDLKDLRAMLSWVGENAQDLTFEYGNVNRASVGAIQRRLMQLEAQGGAAIFGEPALDINDLMRRDADGRGVVNILDATTLINRSPDLYACFLLWLLSELFEELPEQGDAERPRFVLFFDEAHLLFDRAPRALLEKIEQVVRLIRSKGVGVYFVTQGPGDIPEDVLGQLGMKVQHALRAFTPRERKTVRVVADSFRPNPALDAASLVTELGTGEALVSVLAADGTPTPVEHVLIRPPESRIGPLDAAERQALIGGDALHDKYARAIDRESAFEVLAERARARAEARVEEPPPTPRTTPRTPARRASNRQSAGEAMVKSTLRAIGSSLGRQIVRGLLGSIFGGRR